MGEHDLKNIENRDMRKKLHNYVADREREEFLKKNLNKITIITLNKNDEDYLSDYAFVKIKLSKPIKARDLGYLIIEKIGDLV